MEKNQSLEVTVIPSGQIKAILDGIERLEKRYDDLCKNLPTNSHDELLTKKETAKFLKVSDSSIYLWTKRGKLKAHGISGRVFYKKSEVQAALKEL